MSTPAFSIKNLTLKYGETTVIADLDCEIKAGRITYLVGSNGAGKSTLIKALIGRHPLYSGKVRIFGETLSSESVSKNIGYVPQYSGIDRSFPITVREMIELECSNPKHCPVGISGHLKVLNAEKLLNEKISDLSGGELQKALIARALVNDPKILILDEPFNNLDHETETELIKLLRELHTKEDKTIIFVTHDLNIINPNNSDTLFLTHQKGVIGGSAEILRTHNLTRI